jgi:hypothetical protein
MDAAKSVTASFGAHGTTGAYNLVFVTAGSLTANLGSPAAYDQKCNEAATAVGLNNAAGNGYRAWISTAGSLAKDRITAAGAAGWIRMDGRAVADTMANLTGSSKIWNRIDQTELGTRRIAQVWTGTHFSGSVFPNCSDWTLSSGGSGTMGSTQGGPGDWTSGGAVGCDAIAPIYCFEVTATNTTNLPFQTAGKRIFLSSSTFTPGGGLSAAHTLCQGDRPGGMTSAKALLATSGTAASTAASLTASEVYVTMAGQRIGLGSDIAHGVVDVAPWIDANGAYPPGAHVWTGSPRPDALGGTSGTVTCADWTTNLAGSNGTAGISSSESWWRWTATDFACNLTTFRLYCVEQ